MPRSAWGANNRPNFALIGAGGRGRYLNRIFQQDGPKCVAVAEVYEPNMEEALKGAPGPRRTSTITNCCKKRETSISLCWRTGPSPLPMMLAALEAKKDIYAEKPLSKSLEESATMVAAVRRSKQVVQIGMQRRSAPAVMAAKKLVDDGVLGRITLVKPQWHWNVAKPLNNSPLPGKIDWSDSWATRRNAPSNP